jgi:hypothetical protein
MFLAFESLLDHVAPKQPNEGETAWLERALTDATATRGLDLSRFAKPRNKPVQDFLGAHYSSVRCAIFHAKSSSGQSLLPGSLRDYDLVLQQVRAPPRTALGSNGVTGVGWPVPERGATDNVRHWLMIHLLNHLAELQSRVGHAPHRAYLKPFPPGRSGRKKTLRLSKYGRHPLGDSFRER